MASCDFNLATEFASPKPIPFQLVVSSFFDLVQHLIFVRLQREKQQYQKSTALFGGKKLRLFIPFLSVHVFCDPFCRGCGGAWVFFFQLFLFFLVQKLCSPALVLVMYFPFWCWYFTINYIFFCCCSKCTQIHTHVHTYTKRAKKKNNKRRSGIKAFSLFHFSSSRFGSLLLTFARNARERANPKIEQRKRATASVWRHRAKEGIAEQKKRETKWRKTMEKNAIAENGTRNNVIYKHINFVKNKFLPKVVFNFFKWI